MAGILALHGVTAILRKKDDLVRSFNPLGNYPQFHGMRQGDYRLNNYRTGLIHCDAVYERLINLERINGETLKITQAGITRVKIITCRLAR